MPREESGLTKSELIDMVADRLRMARGRAETIVNVVFDAMIEALRSGEGIEIRGFGTFTLRDYKPYEGRNPRTGAKVSVAPKRLPFFKVGKELRERVDRGRTLVAAGAGGQAPAPAAAGAAAPGASPSAGAPASPDK